MKRSIKLLQLNHELVLKLENQHIYQVSQLSTFDFEKGGFSKVEEKVIVDAFETYKQEELTKELRGRENYFSLEYLNDKYSFEKLGLSLRAFNALLKNNIDTVAKIIEAIIHFEIYEIDYLGATSAHQVLQITRNIIKVEELEQKLPLFLDKHRYDDVSLEELGLFKQMVAKLEHLGYTSLGKLRIGYLDGSLGNLFNYKTMQSFTNKLLEYFSFTSNNHFEFFKQYLIENRFGFISWDEIKTIIGTQEEQHLENLKSRLQHCNDLIVSDQGIRLPLLMEKFQFVDIKKESEAILIARFQGETLQSVANEFHKTRERIRQIVRDRLAKIDIFLEQALVKEYNRFIWHPEVFKRVYGINDFSLNVVKYLGNKYPFNAKYEFPEEYILFLFSNNLVEEFSLLDFKLHFPRLFVPKIQIYGKEYDSMTRRQFLEFVIQNFIPKKGMHKSKIIQKANQVALENHLDYKYDKYVDIVSNTIQGLRNVRYYDYSFITPKVISRLAEIIKQVDTVYSCTYFFKKQIEFLRTIDVHDGYELHFLLRRLFANDEKYKDKIDFNRQPMIGPVGISFSSVVVNFWKQQKEVVELDWFINELIHRYGYHVGTLTNIINSSLGDYICFRKVYRNKPAILPKVFAKMKQIMVDDFYELNELITILEKNEIKLSDYQYFSNFWLEELGFKTHDINYIIKKKYFSLKDLFFERVLKHDVYELTIKDRSIKDTTLILFIETLRSSYQMFPIRYEKLISMRYFEAKGITEQSFRDYVAALENYLPPNTYFSYESLLKENYFLANSALKKVEDYHLDYEIMVDLIRNVKGVKKTTKGDLFRISNESTIINNFLDELQNTHHFKTLEALKAFVWENYKISIKNYKFEH